jgi:Niemann-Pick C1 protein
LIPAGSYVNDYLDATDEYFPEQGIDLYITFQGSSDIYADRDALSELDLRLTGLSTSPPYISEPVSEEAYRNVMDGLSQYLASFGTSAIGGAALGDDGWPTTKADFVSTLALYASNSGPGAVYAQDVSFSEDRATLRAYRVRLQYVKLVKTSGGEIIPDAEKQIDAMDATRAMVDSWTDLPPAFAYSDEFQTIEGYKVIQRELFLNVALALVAITIIVFLTVANVWAALIIAFNVAFCIVEILGFMWALGIVIDSVSVISLALAVGLSVDYSAHTGHCFMTKGGTDRNKRATEALCDIGAAVLQGGFTTFLAVMVLLFSNSYIFWVLSRQFALTVALGLFHGLVLLPVMMSLVGPKPYLSAEAIDVEDETVEKPGDTSTDKIGSTAHTDAVESAGDGSDDIGKVDTAVKVDVAEEVCDA